jgi:hypothetical protein
MPIDFDDAAASAAATLRAGRLDGEPRPDVRLLCRRLAVRLELVPPYVLRGGHAARYSAVGDKIVRRRALPTHVDAFVLAHELGHRWRYLAGVPFDEVREEHWCNAFAGALLVPGESLFTLWRRGHDLSDLMEAYPHVAATCLALRVGEARLAETVVVQGQAVRHIRASRAPGVELVALGVEAARSGRASSPGLARAWRMPEVPRRAAVIMDATG